jgi:hypothetical protein
MDDRDRAKSKVIPLRRKGRSENGDREHVASKIFAEEDGIGPFSLGNLIPPKHRAPPDDAHGILPDGFEREREPGPASTLQDAAVDEEPDEFFEELIAHTSVGTLTDGAPPKAPTLPGSAYLPNELPATDGARRVSVVRLVERLATRRGDAARATLEDKAERPSSRMVRPAALVAVAIAVLASSAAAVLLGHGGHARPSVGALQSAQSAPSIEPRPASAAAWAALREHTKAPGGRRHHPARPRHRKTARSHKSSSPASRAATSTVAVTTSTQPVYHAPASPTPSASHHASSGGHHAGPTGTVSLIGAGTTPSG